MRLTCSSLSFLMATPEEAITMIAELDFPALDLVSIPSLPTPHVDIARRDPAELRRLAELVNRTGIEVASVVAVPSDGLSEWDRDEIDARVGWAAQAADTLGARRVVLDAGNPIAGETIDRPRAIERWKAMVQHGFEQTSAAGVALVIEAPHTGTLAERFDQVAELMDALGLPAVGLDYDTSHVYRSRCPVDESLRLVGDRLAKVALRDVDSQDEFCRPGEGLVDFRQLFALLRARAYDGDLVIELETPGIDELADQRREVELTRAYVEGLLAE